MVDAELGHPSMPTRLNKVNYLTQQKESNNNKFSIQTHALLRNSVA